MSEKPKPKTLKQKRKERLDRKILREKKFGDEKAEILPTRRALT